MKTLLRKIYYRIRYLPVIGGLAQSFVAFVRNSGYGVARTVDSEQARQVSSLAERLEVVSEQVRQVSNLAERLEVDAEQARQVSRPAKRLEVDSEQARPVSSLAERLEVVELLTKSQAHALTGLNNACKTLKRELLEQSEEHARQLQEYKQLIGPQLQRQSQRTEFVRDEVMFELRRALKIKPAAVPGSSTPGNNREQTLTPRILDHVKLNAGQALRLNVGCGHIPHPDKLNVDIRELPGVDVIADADNLPFEEASIDLLYSAHLLEHFPRRYLLDVLLPYWSSLLKADGVLQLVVPDAQAMIAAHKRGEMDFETLAQVTFGKQDYDGDFHYAMYSPRTLTELLSEAGFNQIEVLADDRINGDCREMEIHARKT